MPEAKPKKDESKDSKKSSIVEHIKRTFLNQRKLFFWSEVTDETCRKLSEEILFLEMEDPGKEITLYLSSPGGSVTAGLALYDIMVGISSPIKIIVTGIAASMGSILLSAGKKGSRFILPHGRVLIHQPLIMGKIVAPAVDINIHAAEMEKQRDELVLILSKASGQPLEKIENDSDRDFYMNAKEALEYGLVDKIISKL